MRDFGRSAVISVIQMTREDRLEHVVYYRARMRELAEMGQWAGPEGSEARAMISTRLAALDRTVAIIQGSGS